VFAVKNQQFPAPLKLKATFTPVTPVCPTYKRELRHIMQECNHIKSE